MTMAGSPVRVGWLRAAWGGWSAYYRGQRLEVRKYRRGDGRGWLYVARVDNTARISPAPAFRTLRVAQAEAIDIANDRAATKLSTCTRPGSGRSITKRASDPAYKGGTNGQR